jgi:hypothetical protein
MNLEGLIPLLGGLYVLLMARGIVPVGNDPEKAEQWRKRWGRTINWVAPITMIFGILLLFRVI